MAFLLALLEAIFGHLVAHELLARWPHLIHSLVKSAARKLPEFHREEMEKEWLAEIEAIPGPITKIVHSLDFMRAAYSISMQERRIASERDWLIVGGSIQVLAGVAGIWLLERIESFPTARQSQLFKWTQINLLTFMVQGYSRHPEAHLTAAERFAECGNSKLEDECKVEGERLANTILDHIVEVSLIRALQSMQDEGTI